MLAGDEPALAVPRVAIREIGGLSEVADRAGFLLPFDDALVWNVATEQIAPVAEPHRTLGPAQAGRQPLHRREFQPVFFEAGIECLYRRIGIVARRPPAWPLLGMGRCLIHVGSLVSFPLDNPAIIRDM